MPDANDYKCLLIKIRVPVNPFVLKYYHGLIVRRWTEEKVETIAENGHGYFLVA